VFQFHTNRQRVKTPEQVAREARQLIRIEKERAKARQKKHGGTAPGKKKTVQEEVPEVMPQARDLAGEQLGVSGKTAEKMADVADAIDEAEAAGDTEKAEDIRQTLNTKSVAAADRVAKNEAFKPKPKPKDDDDQDGSSISESFSATSAAASGHSSAASSRASYMYPPTAFQQSAIASSSLRLGPYIRRIASGSVVSDAPTRCASQKGLSSVPHQNAIQSLRRRLNMTAV
jgi:hypothetical protein